MESRPGYAGSNWRARKKVVAFLLVIVAPFIWYYSLGINSIMDLPLVKGERFLLSTGVYLFLWGLSFVVLPVDMIPDFLPILGRIDDVVAYLIMIFGGVLVLLGIALWINSSPAATVLTGPS